ncbi:MAG: zinc-ribbon domain-containing protein [Lachnospiraceae bacterium]|nr:zinc-ribbon domain-containing protein [Lachnospiraceae bacterium]
MAFLEKVGGTLAAKGKDVAEKAKIMAEVSRLNGQINTQKSVAEKLYVEIGKMVCEKREDWKSMDVTVQLEQLDAIQVEIAGLQEKLLRVKGVRRCDSCGSEVDRKVEFCPKCGSALEVLTEEDEKLWEDTQGMDGALEKIQQEAEAAHCPQCNKEMEEGMIFCPFCGEKLK